MRIRVPIIHVKMDAFYPNSSMKWRTPHPDQRGREFAANSTRITDHHEILLCVLLQTRITQELIWIAFLNIL